MEIPVGEWRREQARLARRVVLGDEPRAPRRVAGFDAAYAGDVAVGALVVVDAQTLEPVRTRTARLPAPAPYVPGFLAWRELPVLEAVWAPGDADLLLVDGAGVLHPARCGFASHAGIALDVPTLGVTNRPFVGVPDGRPADVGDAVPVRLDGEHLGWLLRSAPPPARPLFVSPGHRVGVEGARRAVVALLRGARLPEPLRLAHAAATRAARS